MSVQPDIVFGRGELRLDLFTPLPERSLRAAVLQLHAGSWRMGDRKMLWSRALILEPVPTLAIGG